jgi:hypothetical protein
VLPKRLLGCRLRHHSRGTKQRARVTHHSGLRYGHCRNVRQSGIWSDTTAGRGARSASHIIVREYVGDQERIAWSEFGLQPAGKTDTEHPSKLKVLPQPEDGLGRTLWSHAALQQYHVLMVQVPLPHEASRAYGLLLHV